MLIPRISLLMFAAATALVGHGQCEGGTATVDPDTVCGGEPVELVLTSYGPDQDSLQWQFFDLGNWQDIPDQTDDTAQVSPAVNTQYRCLVFCPGDTAISDTVLVSVTTPISVTVIQSPEVHCELVNATLTASGADSYSWSPSTGLSSSTGSQVLCAVSQTTTYTVTGTTGPCSDTATIQVVVTAPPQVAVTSSSTGPFCAAANTILTVLGMDSATWSPATGLSAISGTSVTCTASTTTVYIATGWDNGCSGTDTIQVEVTPAPIVVITTSDAGPFCTAANALFSVIAMDSVLWSPATGLSATFGNPVTCTTTTTGTYTATGWNDGCSATDEITVVVNDVLPSPTITADGPLTFCEGDSVVLSSDANNPLWSTGATTSSISVTVSGTITVSDSVPGCATVVSDTVIVIVSTFQVPDCPNDTLICLTTPPFAWAVDPGGSFSFGGLFDADSAGIGPHPVVYTLVNGNCTGTCPVTITVEGPPNAGTSGSVTVCANGVPFDLNDELGTHDTGGTWNGPGGTLPGGVYDPTVHIAGDQVYSVLPDSVCGTATATIVVIETQSPATPLPQAVGVDTVCTGQYMDVSLANEDGNAGYTWSCTGCTLEPNTGPVVEAHWTGAGEHTLSVTAAFAQGCSSDTTISVFISAQPASCPRGIVYFEPHGLAILDTAANHFQWGTLEGATFLAVPGATNQTYFHSSIVDCDSADFVVRTSINGECWSTTTRCADADMLARPCEAPPELGMLGAELRAFPNPWSGGPLTIAPVHTGSNTPIAIVIIDPQGRVHFSGSVPPTGGVLSTALMDALPRGPFVLRATINGLSLPGGTSTLKLIVQ